LAEKYKDRWLALVMYQAFKKLVSVCFNIFNFLLGGNLPPFACATVIVEEQNRFLVIKRPNGRLSFPGGFMRWREYPMQTARRECKEETGLDVRIGEIIGYRAHASNRIDRMSVVNIIFRGEVVGGELHHSIEGRAFWIDEDEMRGRLRPAQERVFKDYLHYRNRNKETSTSQA
jgi:ADP-ribose pyrophosphatase YjhB (NUDIX family)